MSTQPNPVDAKNISWDIAGKEETMAQMTWRRFKRHKLAIVGLTVLIVMYLMAIFAPYLAPFKYDAIDTANRLKGPTAIHWFGTDHLGRDILSRMLYGSRVSLSVGFVAAGFSVTIGVVVGALAGFYGGQVDNILMRITEVVRAFPTFFLLITVVSVLPRNLFNIMIVIGLTSWPGLAMMVRGQILSLREMDYTQAARVMGANDGRVIFRHILPNAFATVIVSTTLRIGGAIMTESGLSFLGLGVPVPYPSWGGILSDGQAYLKAAPWIMMFPGLFIFLTVISFNFMGDGLRDALDPKLKQ